MNNPEIIRNTYRPDPDIGASREIRAERKDKRRHEGLRFLRAPLQVPEVPAFPSVPNARRAAT